MAATTESYGYDEGVDVGRQYAQKFGLNRKVEDNELLPDDLQGADLGDLFEIGCREGINSQVDDQQSIDQTIHPESTRPNIRDTVVEARPWIEPDQREPEFEVESQTEYGGNPVVKKATSPEFPSIEARESKPLGKQLTANAITGKKLIDDRVIIVEPNVEAGDVDAEQAAEQLFSESQEIHLDEPQVEAAPLRSVTVDQSEVAELSKSEAGPETTGTDVWSAPGSGKKPRGKSSTDEFVGEIKGVETEPPSTESTNIILSASPVPFGHSPQREVDSNHSTSSQQKADGKNRKPAAKNLIKLTATPSYNINNKKPRTDQSPTKAKRKPAEASVLVDHLEGVGIPLDPVPTLKAASSPGQDETIQSPRTINARYRKSEPVQPKPDASENKTPAAKPSATEAPATKAPATEAPATEAPVTIPTGERLPAVGPNWEKMLQSPFHSVPATNNSQSEPRKASQNPNQSLR